mmetsp:Transcript_3968/g.6091  ORF Transcript_3968/g.6091 Transcript_3968/m.6091 type:complete len:215 (+) Transcript_3968:806-1450(+)
MRLGRKIRPSTDRPLRQRWVVVVPPPRRQWDRLRRVCCRSTTLRSSNSNSRTQATTRAANFAGAAGATPAPLRKSGTPRAIVRGTALDASGQSDRVALTWSMTTAPTPGSSTSIIAYNPGSACPTRQHLMLERPIQTVARLHLPEAVEHSLVRQLRAAPLKSILIENAGKLHLKVNPWFVSDRDLDEQKRRTQEFKGVLRDQGGKMTFLSVFCS